MAETIKIGGELESMATGNVVAAASAIKDKAKGKYQSTINAETDVTLAQHASAINGLNSQNYVSVAATDQTTAVTDVLPATGAANTVYRVGNWDGSQFDASVYSEYAWNGSSYVHLNTKTQVGEVFDISAYHATGGTLATYADLSAALDSNNGGGVPQSLQKGGMSVKFVCTYDNKYVQYMCKSSTWSSSPADWEIINNVSVSQNTETGHIDITVEDTTTPVPSVEQVESLSRDIDNIYNKPEGVELGFKLFASKKFDNTEVGTTLTLVSNDYVDIRKFKIKDLLGILAVNKIQMSSTATIMAVYTDEFDKVIATESYASLSLTTKYCIFNLAAYEGKATYLYVRCSNASGTFVNKFFSDYGVDAVANEVINKTNNVNLVLSGSIPIMPSTYTSGTKLDTPIIGEKAMFTYGLYRWLGVAFIRPYIGCKIKVNNINAASGNGCVVADRFGKILAIISTTSNTPKNAEIDLTLYQDAHYLLWEWSDNYPTSINIQERQNQEIINLNKSLVGYSETEITFTNHNSKRFPSGLAIGDTFTLSEAASSLYRALGEISVAGLRGNININGILPSDGNAVVVNSLNKIIDIVNISSYSDKTFEINISLEKLIEPAKIWFSAPLSNDYSTFGQPVITNYFDGLTTQVDELSNLGPKHGVLLLHFDVPLSSISDRRLQLMKQYGFNVSWCLTKTCFNNSDTFAEWTNNDYKNAYLDALKRGDDFGLYPGRIATAFDEEGWDDYFATALAGLASNGIHNITGFMCGRLDINDDLLNSVKKNGFKIIRGGGSGDAQSVDTYDYTKINTYMPNKPTYQTFFVNASAMVGNNSDYTKYLERLKTKIGYAIETNTAISIFAHNIDPDDTSQTNITEEHLVAILDYIKSQVENSGLMVMPWRKWYNTINRIDGYEWDYNRLLKMQELN